MPGFFSFVGPQKMGISPEIRFPLVEKGLAFAFSQTIIATVVGAADIRSPIVTLLSNDFKTIFFYQPLNRLVDKRPVHVRIRDGKRVSPKIDHLFVPMVFPELHLPLSGL